MYEYKDPDKAAAWFAATTPEDEAYRLFTHYRGEQDDPEWQALADSFDRTADEAEALLKEVGLDLLGFGNGISSVVSGLQRRPSPARHRQGRKTADKVFAYDSYCVVNLNAVAWTWLRPLLVELIELRRRQRLMENEP